MRDIDWQSPCTLLSAVCVAPFASAAIIAVAENLPKTILAIHLCNSYIVPGCAFLACSAACMKYCREDIDYHIHHIFAHIDNTIQCLCAHIHVDHRQENRR